MCSSKGYIYVSRLISITVPMLICKIIMHKKILDWGTLYPMFT